MSTFAEKYGKKTKSPFERLDSSEEVQYTNLETLYSAYGAGKKYKAEALYINDRGKYGPRPAVRIRDKDGKPIIVNFPKHKTDQAERILEDGEAIKEIIEGKVGFQIYSYKGSDGVTYYSANWIEM